VFAGVRATLESLRSTGNDQHFDIFILSDTFDADIAIQESYAWLVMCRDLEAFGQVFYRRRQRRVKRKSGNLDDFCRRWGALYRYMLVLDADSVMSGKCLTRLVQMMEVHSKVGIIQTAPRASGRLNLYARMQQFATRVYGPLFTAGLHFWQLGESHYWGHNAIIRTRAFADAAKLPILAGRAPFGGPVLSHDFVEAALLRRRGWGVRLDVDLDGSFEEAPPSLDDVVIRDRRWCQGNFQHARLLFAGGLTPTSRLNMATGIMAYASAPLWLALVLVGLVLGVQAALGQPEYFGQQGLFPSWPVFDSARAIDLFLVSMGVVLLPKALGWLHAMLSTRLRSELGGGVRATASMLLETLLSALLAPVMMAAQTRIVWQVLAGRDAGWQPQRRDDGAIAFGAALRGHLGALVLGLVLAVLAGVLHRDLFLWLLPLTLGLVLSPLLAFLSGRADLGRGLGRSGLLRARGDAESALLERVAAERGNGPAAPERSLVDWLRADTALRAFHLAQLDPPPLDAPFDADLALARARHEHHADPVALDAAMTSAQAMALLGDTALIRELAGEPARAGRAGALEMEGARGARGNIRQS
jgi:membrane glycosyltransferase